ncbi:MAG: L-Ala--D-Glu endopeptidase precursor [Firmicutes bacterium ADurb.Bin193]|nr:MAG: L-Ala--D-Glu endopeptidase precursor [Firmicutes bacterium ADurb.Bin193]
MFFTIRLKKAILLSIAVIFLVCTTSIFSYLALSDRYYKTVKVNSDSAVQEKKYIKWVDLTVPYGVMEKTLNLDIKSQGTEHPLDWVELMAYLAAKYGGNFKNYKSKDLDSFVARLSSGEKLEDITKDMKYFSYYLEAYTAIFGEFVGHFKVQVDEGGKKVWQDRYGLKVFSPIAAGYGYFHCDDFGNGRTFGYRRKHLGNDLMGSIGTPIIAVESGTVEALGWNIYGGWRIGIRSFDKKRYYYYAHLRKGHPYHKELSEGQIVKAGDVIGYLGMTGYSRREDVNNIQTPHLHFGLQLIFDEVQKDGINQIWVDVYNIVKLLKKHRSGVFRNQETKDFYRVFDIHDPSVPD